MPLSATANRSISLRKRTVLALFVCVVAAAIVATMTSSAATPSSGTLSPATPVLSYDAGPFITPNQSPVGLGQLDTGPRCDANTFPCDNFALTVSLPSGYAAAHPNAAFKVTMFWNDTGSGKSDYDLYIYNGVVGNLSGNQPADHQSASGADPEVAVVNPVVDGDTQYSVKIVPFQPTGETLHLRIELLPGSGGVFPGFGGADPTTPGVPRYQNFVAPSGSSAEGTQGEFNIGFNPHTGRIMVMNIGPIWRLTPGEAQTPSKPECCEALWEDKSANTTNIGLDPILWTDQKSGRTFASNSTAGANAVYAYSDNDGDLWVEAGFSPPNGGADHETIGSGPYPHVAGLPNPLGTAANQGEAVYYCSQDIVGPASCQRSDTLGASYGPGVLAYNGTTTACGGLHGHLHVAPDGTAWLPVNQCNGSQGGALSTDAGITWQEFIVTGSVSQPQGADPSIAIDSVSTVYYAYVNNEPVGPGDPPEGHPHVKVSSDHGATWTRDFDLGASHGIRNAVEIEAVGGSSGRAAVGFLGTDVNGDYQANSFPGKWYAFIATTYDGGVTWTTVNATPNDPVQSMSGVWQQGGGHQDRNLLDFNEITVDDKGRVLYGYSDGCVSEDCIAGAAPNDFTANMRVARQSGGRPLFSQFDPTEPAAPKPACLSGTRDPLASHLIWKVPDNGGADIVDYQILRGTSPGSEALIGQTGGPKPAYHDTTADPSVAHYYYVVKGINAAGTGIQSNEIDLTVTPLPPPEDICQVPGLTRLTDSTGDNHAVLGLLGPAPVGTDLHSFQLAQPYAADGDIKLVFTINTDAGESPQPPGSSWYVAMKIPDPAPATTFHYRAVHMTWSGITPTFESYVPDTNSGGGVDGRFIVDGSQKPAEASSSYAAPFDKVVIVVKASDLGLNPGDTIVGFVSGVSQTAQGVATELIDQMPDSLNFANSYTVNDNAFCAPAPPINVCYEDDDAHIAYSSGWHLVTSNSASAGHFRLHSGKDTTHFASLTIDVPSRQAGTLTYNYAKSTKGGSAEVFIDGVSRGIINYNGPNGGLRDPEFKNGGLAYQVKYDGLSPGEHKFELKNMTDAVYLDSICLESSASNSQPTIGPGQTSSNSASVGAGQQSSSSLSLPTNTKEISVLAEAGGGLPIKLVLIDPTGLTLTTANSTNGVAVLNATVTQGGLYTIKVVNLSLGPVQVWTVATPLITR